MAYHLHQAILVTIRWLVHTTLDIPKSIKTLRALTEQQVRYDTAARQNVFSIFSGKVPPKRGHWCAAYW